MANPSYPQGLNRYDDPTQVTNLNVELTGSQWGYYKFMGDQSGQRMEEAVDKSQEQLDLLNMGTDTSNEDFLEPWRTQAAAGHFMEREAEGRQIANEQHIESRTTKGKKPTKEDFNHANYMNRVSALAIALQGDYEAQMRAAGLNPQDDFDQRATHLDQLLTAEWDKVHRH